MHEDLKEVCIILCHHLADHDSPDNQEGGIADEVKKFESRFFDLVFRLRNEMIQNRTPVIKVRDSITLLPIIIRSEHYQFVKDCSADIRKAEDIEDLFQHLNLYWTYLEYSLLEHIIVAHSSSLSKGLKVDMKRYKVDIEAFKRCTTVEQLLKVGLGIIRREPPPGFARIVSKWKRKASEYTLEELEGIRQSICFAFNLPTFILMLESMDEGSLCIKWHIPSSEVYHVEYILNVEVDLYLEFFLAELFYIESVPYDGEDSCLVIIDNIHRENGPYARA